MKVHEMVMSRRANASFNVAAIVAANISFGTSAIASEAVTVDNFTRAETDHYLKMRADAGFFGTIRHIREPITVEHQPVVRANRDTLYSYGVFDLTTPVTISMPHSKGRFQTIRAINEDHYIAEDFYDPGDHLFTKDRVATRYLYITIRTLANPDDPNDLAAAHALQDQVVWQQADPGKLGPA